MKISKKAAAGMIIGGLTVLFSPIGTSLYADHNERNLKESSSEYRRLREIDTMKSYLSETAIPKGCVLSADGSIPSVCINAVVRYSSLRSEEDRIRGSVTYNDLQKKLNDDNRFYAYSSILELIFGSLFALVGVVAYNKRDLEEEKAKNKPKIEEASSKNRIEASPDLQARIEQTGMYSSTDYEAQCEAELRDFDERFEKKHGKLESW